MGLMEFVSQHHLAEDGDTHHQEDGTATDNVALEALVDDPSRGVHVLQKR